MKICLFLALVASSATLASTSIIYGEDNRRDIKDVLNPEIQLLSKSVAGRVSNFSFKKDENNLIHLLLFLKFHHLIA